jgi:hypothetical protein
VGIQPAGGHVDLVARAVHVVHEDPGHPREDLPAGLLGEIRGQARHLHDLVLGAGADQAVGYWSRGRDRARRPLGRHRQLGEGGDGWLQLDLQAHRVARAHLNRPQCGVVSHRAHPKLMPPRRYLAEPESPLAVR